MNFYNDIDPFCCDWLRALVDAGELPAGHVEQRSVLDVEPKDLAGFTQCHWFCGIGGWPLALRMAGWRPDAPVWTASLPCQPLSCAGKQRGDADERHLWPGFFRLVRECSPAIIFGEQVASKDGLEWLDGVFADLEDANYSCGAADLCSPGVGAPHIRQRLYWVAYSASRAELRDRSRSEQRNGEGARGRNTRPDCCGSFGGLADGGLDRSQGAESAGGASSGVRQRSPECSIVDGVADPECPERRPAVVGGFDGLTGQKAEWSQRTGGPELCGEADGLGLARNTGLPLPEPREPSGPERDEEGRAAWEPSRAWVDARFVQCRDQRVRRVGAQPGDEPLAYGIPRRVGQGFAGLERVGIVSARANRVGRLRGYGNAIVPEVAAEFIRAVMESLSR